MINVRLSAPAAAMDQTIQLSLCDAYSPKIWVMQTHFWPMKDSSSFERIFSLLQEGLRRTIAEIPALAGTVGHGPSGDPRDLVISITAGSHVDFSCEDLTGNDGVPSYAALVAEGFPMTKLMGVLAPQTTLHQVSAGAPMLAAKLNLLRGGVALSFGFNHLIVDASGVAEVERMWAMHTANVSSGKEQNHTIETPDLEIRRRLSTAAPGAGDFQHAYWGEYPIEGSPLDLPREAVSVERRLEALQQSTRDQLPATGAEDGETNWGIWYFSPENLSKLKAEASGPDESKWISTIDAVIGLFWSQLASIHPQSQDQPRISAILFPINVRQRLEPSIHSNYIGNAVDIVISECALSQLSDPSGLSTAAQCVRKAVNSWSQSAFDAWLKRAATLSADKLLCPDPLFLLATTNVAFNDYSKSQSHTLDWGGELGQVARTRYMRPAASLANCGTAIIVHPRLADGGLEVAVSCNGRVQRMLEANRLFQAYGKLVCISA